MTHNSPASPCGKRCHRTPEAAETHRQELLHHNRIHQPLSAAPEVYFCADCAAYHIGRPTGKQRGPAVIESYTHQQLQAAWTPPRFKPRGKRLSMQELPRREIPGTTRTGAARLAEAPANEPAKPSPSPAARLVWPPVAPAAPVAPVARDEPRAHPPLEPTGGRELKDYTLAELIRQRQRQNDPPRT